MLIVFIYLFPFLRCKLKRECLATFVNFKGKRCHMVQLFNVIYNVFPAHIVLIKELKTFT